MKLLAGYVQSKKGDIQIDGQSLAEIRLIDYYKKIGYLTQDPSVFDGTIRDNLLYALDHEPSEKEISDVIRKAKCEFVFELEFGIETEI